MSRETEVEAWHLFLLLGVCAIAFGLSFLEDGELSNAAFSARALGLLGGIACILGLLSQLGTAVLTWLEEWEAGREDAARAAEAPTQSPLLSAFISGHVDGRVVHTRDGEEAVRRHRGQEAAVHVTTDQLALWVRVEGEQTHALDLTPGRLPSRLRQALRITAPAEPDALDGLLIGDDVEAALRLLFGSFQARRVWLERGRLHVLTGFAPNVVSARWVAKILDALVQLSSLLGEMRVMVKVAVVSAEQARCPYCHDDADAPQGVTRCSACGTAHHAECWTEAGGCTVLGCAQRRPAARARAR